MIRYFGCWVFCFVTLTGIAGLTRAEKSKNKGEKEPVAKTEAPVAKDEKPAVAPPPCHTVKREPLKVTITLDGIFEAEKTEAVFVNPKEWTTLKVETAARHGARVRKGDVLLTLDTEKLDRAIDDLRTELKIADVSIQQGEDKLQALEKLTPLDLEASNRDSRIGEENRKYFVDVERPFMLKMADFRLKVAEESLEYEEEELRQLEKMYKADEITEETEQIVLKRARDTVEKAKFMVEYAKLDRDETLKFIIPRADEMIEDVARRRSIDWERDQVSLPLALEKQRLELEKLRVQREKNSEKLEKLLADRTLMTVKAPIGGIVYYGKCVRGKFSDSTGMAEKLCRNGSIQPNQVVMTVLAPRPMFIQAAVAESKLHYLRPGLKGTATPAGYPELKLSAEIDEVGDVPTAPGSFDAKLSVQLTRKAKWLMPGMNCEVKLVPYLKKDAVCVPPKYVHADALDDEKHYVWLLDKDGKPQRRDVKVGKETKKQVEIRKGLKEGDKVLLEAPKEQE